MKLRRSYGVTRLVSKAMRRSTRCYTRSGSIQTAWRMIFRNYATRRGRCFHLLANPTTPPRYMRYDKQLKRDFLH